MTPARQGRGTRQFLVQVYVRSLFFLRRAFRCPEHAEFPRVPLPRRVQGRDAATIECYLRASIHRWSALQDQTPDGVCNLRCVVVDQCIGQTHCVSLLTSVDSPDERVILGVEFVDSGLLLNHFWSVHPKSSFACHNNITAEPYG